jgi:adenine-specific DNA-methyltransferase
MAYCKVLLDQIFGRKNYLNTISITTNEPSGFKATSSSIFSTANYILVYAKDKSKASIQKVYIEKHYDKAYSKVIENIEDHFSEWRYTTIKEIITKEQGFESVNAGIKKIGRESFEKLIKEFAIKNAHKVFRTAAVGGGAKIKRQATINKSKEERNKVIMHPKEDVPGFYILNGEQILFYNKRLEKIDGELKPAQVITDIWTDISVTGIAKEGNVVFKNGKKPEKLIKRCLEMTSSEGDWVLDSFAGSGTTAAVAHKMKRNWITVELGNQAYEHCIPRLSNIIDNKDSTGVTTTVNWQGGGGFKFYELAPSLLNKDQYDNWVISKEYNANMLAAAMAKQEGFSYSPNTENYWKQGFSSEQDFIYTTTQFVTVELLDQLNDQLQEGESLLICAKKFQPECANRFGNISLKKIPQMLLGKCEFAKDDYSLNIINLPQEDDIYETEEE